MDAKKVSFLQTLGSKIQFIVPIYQRNYSWTDKQNNRLLDDIIKVGRQEGGIHFIGSVVFISSGVFQPTTIENLQLIDGQQRITTISILLHALSELLEDILEDIRDYLIHHNRKGQERYKLLLSFKDRDTYTRIIDGDKDVYDDDSLIDNTYRFFRDKLSSKTKEELEVIWQGILKLAVVQISLDHNDNPQLIFETLNSTGRNLSEADKIRNYLLMNLEQAKQELLYKNKWLPIESIFNNSDKDDRFDRFVRDYLVMKYGNGRLVNLGDVYDEFKSYARDSKKPFDDLADDLLKYSKYYSCIHMNTEKNKKLAIAFNDLKWIKVEVSYPFLLKVYSDYADGIINESEFLKIIRTIESYTFRRQVCDLPTRGQNKIFAKMIEDVDIENYVESIQCDFLKRKNEYRFPTNQEFKEQFSSRDIFKFRPGRYTLIKLEDSYHLKSTINATHSIEHIMPQSKNLSKKWRNMLGSDFERIHETYLHTIGNLTLTAYNPEMSNKSFTEKKQTEGGFSSSPLMLNKIISEFDIWDESSINSRAQKLSERSTEIWFRPNIKEDTIEKYINQNDASTPSNSYELSAHFENKQEKLSDLFDSFWDLITKIDTRFETDIFKHHINIMHGDYYFGSIKIRQNQITVYFNDNWCDFEQMRRNDNKEWINAIEDDNGEWHKIKFALVLDDDLSYAEHLLKTAYNQFISLDNT